MSILHPSNPVAERIVLVQFQAEMGKAEALGGAWHGRRRTDPVA
jgi:hypothetical protein